MKCPKCGMPVMKETDWSPKSGLDPDLVELKCRRAKCGYKVYVHRAKPEAPTAHGC